MKIRNFLAALALCLTAASAQASTILQPTDTNVNFFTDSINFVDFPGYTIGVFDAGDFGGTALVVDMLPSIFGLHGGTIDIFPFSSVPVADYFANNGTDTIGLGSTNDFIVGLSIDGGMSWMMDAGVSYSANGDIASLMFVDSGTVIAIDVVVSPVPVPAAAWLFGTGLIGLAGVARRRA